MDYRLMYIKLEALRKEIRSNVPMLALVDKLTEKIQSQFEEIIWDGRYQKCDLSTGEYRENTMI